jgi:hypothetical protein
MNRSKDLDNIAPDDPIITDQKPKVTVFDKILNQSSNIVTKNRQSIDNNTGFKQNVYELLGHSKSPFSNFLVNPKVLTFAEQDEDEEIYLAVRPHLISNLSWIAMSILMLIIPFFFSYFSFLDFLPLRYRLSAIFFWYLITFMFAFEKFLSWYFDFYLITNKRIVDISFNNLLNKHFAQTDISMIQDVSSSVKGFLGTFFNFGDLLIQTAAEINQINFEKVPNPSKIIKLVKELQEADKQSHQGGSHD